MPQHRNDCNNFLNNDENKTKLINFFLSYFSTQKVRGRFKVKLHFTESTNTWEITPSGINMIFTCNHHKPDKSVVLHAPRSIKPVIMTATDTDVLVLLTHVKHSGNNFNFFVNSIFQILPVFHSITACGTNSYPFGVGKISPFKKNASYKIGNTDLFKMLDKPKLFLQTILYSGIENKTFVSTRKRPDESQKYQNSSHLIPNAHSVDEHLKQADLQTFIWRQCMENIIQYPDSIDKTWQNIHRRFAFNLVYS